MMYYRFLAVLLIDTLLVNSWRMADGENAQWNAYMALVAGTLALYPVFIALSQMLGWRASKFAVIALLWHTVVQMLEIRDVLCCENLVPPTVEFTIYFAGLVLITVARYWVGDKPAHKEKN